MSLIASIVCQVVSLYWPLQTRKCIKRETALAVVFGWIAVACVAGLNAIFIFERGHNEKLGE